jgi:LPS-assembly lipoprotein
LRGAYTLPYESLHIALPDGSIIGAGLKRQIRAGGGTRIVETREEAQGSFQQVADLRERQILSLSTAGRVREVRLRYRYSYRVIDPKGRELVQTTGIELTRDVTYDDSAVLSKEQEELLLWRDMENDLIQQLLRRLAAVKPAALPEGQ